jgi:AAA ATPase domain
LAAVGRVQARPVGRDEELAVLDQFLVTGGGFHGLVLVGGPGIGKSTLWNAGVAAAPERGSRVLSACASGAEARLAFAGLIDLFEDVGDETLATLPGPQQRALRVALLRIEPEGAAPEAGAIALGALNALRTLAALDRLLIAIDDVQWLDAPSADVLAFVIRRLDFEPIGFLLARRAGWASAVESAFGPSRAEQLEIGPLSLGAIRRLLATRLGLNLPRHVLRRVVDATLGNPLFALELGRMLVEEGVPAIGEELPVPDAVEDLVGTRVAGLPPAMRRLLLAVALSADPSASELEAIAGSDALAEAVDAGLLHIDGERVRASHPLLAAAARKHSQSALRRDLHLELARVVADEELRARHLALATEGTDRCWPESSGSLRRMPQRGACREAVELAEQALRLTPPSASERPDRVLALAGYLETAGERQRVTDLLMPELEFLPRGAARVRAWLLLSEGGAVKSYHDHARYFDRALAESRGDRGPRASVLAAQALNTVAEGVERIREAEAWAREALDEAMVGSPELEQLALRALSWARSLRGQPFEDACERFGDTADHAAHLMDSPGVVAGLRLAWRGEVERAREILTRFLALADVRGEAVSYAWLRLNVCELELRTGEAPSGRRSCTTRPTGPS